MGHGMAMSKEENKQRKAAGKNVVFIEKEVFFS